MQISLRSIGFCVVPMSLEHLFTYAVPFLLVQSFLDICGDPSNLQLFCWVLGFVWWGGECASVYLE